MIRITVKTTSPCRAGHVIIATERQQRRLSLCSNSHKQVQCFISFVVSRYDAVDYLQDRSADSVGYRCLVSGEMRPGRQI